MKMGTTVISEKCNFDTKLRIDLPAMQIQLTINTPVLSQSQSIFQSYVIISEILHTFAAGQNSTGPAHSHSHRKGFQLDEINKNRVKSSTSLYITRQIQEGVSAQSW